MTAYQQILKLIAALSPSELSKLPGAIGALTGLSVSNAREPERGTDDERWVLDTVVEVAAMFGEFTTVSQLQRSHYIAEFRRNLPGLLEFLSQSGTLTRNEQRALLRLGVRLWFQHRNDIRIPATARQFLQQGNVAAMINKSFPGYVENGLVKLIVRRIKHGG